MELYNRIHYIMLKEDSGRRRDGKEEDPLSQRCRNGK